MVPASVPEPSVSSPLQVPEISRAFSMSSLNFAGNLHALSLDLQGTDHQQGTEHKVCLGKTQANLDALSQPSYYVLSPLENLPDELLLEIAESSWTDHQHPQVWIALNLVEREKPSYGLLHPAYNLTLVSKRLRDVYLPWLFREVRLILHSDLDPLDEIFRLKQTLSRYVHIVKLFRRVHLHQMFARWNEPFEPAYHLLLLQLLHLCPRLQTVEYPCLDLQGHWAEQTELFHAIEHHPSSSLRVSCQGPLTNLSNSPELPPQDSDISLNRVLLEIDITHLVGSAPHTAESIPYNLILSLIQRGLQIVKIEFGAAVTAGGLPSDTGDFIPWYTASLSLWMKPTYTGLQTLGYLSLKEVGSYPGGWLEFQDFLSRHPLLQSIHLRGPSPPTPWIPTAYWLNGMMPWGRCLASIPDPFLLFDVVVVRNCDSTDDSDAWEIQEITVFINHVPAEQIAEDAHASDEQRLEEEDGDELSEEEKNWFAALGKVLPAGLRHLDIRCHGCSSQSESFNGSQDFALPFRISLSAECHHFVGWKPFDQMVDIIYDNMPVDSFPADWWQLPSCGHADCTPRRQSHN
ncbi:hypothetical protein D9758_011600 [Tetrapyrgos nigripes]|uniref:Uncharacterized protein n=1 Tax=Tetrapyrgos nigripes TaxID=182062 RepID=A0A8H5CNW3_9AGAR|nr:hypothetical protein D9758_011600 [Tetrapyrgos nigripes]